MAMVREGNKGVSIVVDTQIGVVRDTWDFSRMGRDVSRAFGRARAKDVPVTWIRHSDENLTCGSLKWQWRQHWLLCSVVRSL